MAFVTDPKNLDRVSDPEKGWDLMQRTRDVPAGEHRWRFQIEGVDWWFETKFSILEASKNFCVDANVGRLEDSFRLYLPKMKKADDEHKLFHNTVLPALHDALVCLLTRKYVTPRYSLEGWKVVVCFAESPNSQGEKPSLN